MHAHVIPRYLDDPAPNRPLPGSLWVTAAALPADELHRQVAALRAAATHPTE